MLDQNYPGGHEPLGHPDADAHAPLPCSEELLHCWVSPFLFSLIAWSFMLSFEFHFATSTHSRFALFLCLVIKRLVGLISANAGLQVNSSDNHHTKAFDPQSENINQTFRWPWGRKLNLIKFGSHP